MSGHGHGPRRREHDVRGLRLDRRLPTTRCSTATSTAVAVPPAARLAGHDDHPRAGQPGGVAAGELPQPGRHVRHRRRGAGDAARHPAACDRDGHLVGHRARRPAAGAGAGGLPRRCVRRRPGLRRRRDPATGDHDVVPLPPRRGQRAAPERRPRARVGHRPDPRQQRRVPGARGQRAGAVRGVLRDDEPPGDHGGAAGDDRPAPDPPGRRLPPTAAGARCARRRRPASPTRPSSSSPPGSTTVPTSSTRCWPGRWASSWSRAATWCAAAAR